MFIQFCLKLWLKIPHLERFWITCNLDYLYAFTALVDGLHKLWCLYPEKIPFPLVFFGMLCVVLISAKISCTVAIHEESGQAKLKASPAVVFGFQWARWAY